MAEGTLVETWQFFEQHKVPPASDGARRKVLADAAEAQSRLARIDERVARGVGLLDSRDADWARRYRALQARLVDLVTECRAGKAVAA